MNSKIQLRSTNVTRVENKVDRALRTERNRHVGGVLWFTGLPSAGKTTLARELLFAAKSEVELLGTQIVDVDEQYRIENTGAVKLAMYEQDNLGMLRKIERTRELKKKFRDAMWLEHNISR